MNSLTIFIAGTVVGLALSLIATGYAIDKMVWSMQFIEIEEEDE